MTVSKAVSLLSLYFFATAVTAWAVEPVVHPILQPFNYHGVTLNDGLYKAQLDDVHSYYLNLSDDDLLKPFRIRAKHPAPGRDLGGWYTTDRFHIFGQIVSGLARIYAATGDEKCRDKANRLVDEWALCIAPDGYFYADPPPNAPHYIYDKMVSGLLDDFLYCHHKQSLQHLSRITDWAQKNLKRNFNVPSTNEWYTLSENLYRAYLATGDAKYRDFAEVWKYNDYWGCYADHVDLFTSRDPRKKEHYHAYSHVNTLGGAGLAYAVTGRTNYLATIVNGFNYLRTNELYATGGFGPNERLLPRTQLVAALETTHKSFETQCGAWAVFKLCKQLIAYTGDSSPGDWVESVALNGLCATIPMTTNGNVFYYSDYNLHGGQKINVPISWSCCAGTRPQAAADLDDLVYFKNSDNLFINQFTASTVHWDHTNGSVIVTQNTTFPESDAVTFTFTVSKPTTFALTIRAPAWLASPMQWKINDTETKYTLDSHGWASLRREWKNGEVLTVKLPMQLHFVPMGKTNSFPAAVAYGPVVLAFQAPNAKPIRELARTNILQSLNPTPGKPLHFTLATDQTIRAVPFYSIPENQPYYIYLSPRIGANISTAQIHFTGRWKPHPRFHSANQPGSTIQADFEGTSVRWIGYRFPDAGRAEVAIDGKKIAVVDQYGPRKEEPFVWAHSGLPEGHHSITVRIVPEKNPQSSNHFINIAAFAQND